MATILSHLFMKQVGGTPIGNAIRNFVNKGTDGLLGAGSGVLTEKQGDLRDLSDAAFLAKYGMTKEGIPYPEIISNSTIKSTTQAMIDAGKNTKLQTAKSLFKTWWWLLVPFGFIVGAWKAYKKYWTKRPSQTTYKNRR